MGNSVSKKYQNFYLDSMFTTIKENNDKLIGKYNIIKFHNENDIFMVTTLDPSLYHHYTDVELFKKKFSKTSSYLSTFLFVEMNKDKNDQFDFIFEFGNFFKNLLTEENKIIEVLNNLLESLIELEEKNLHYPKLDKNYIIKNNFGKTKLLNPLCFYEFLEDLTNVYINPNISESKKNCFSKKKLDQNKNDFLKFVLSLFTQINYDLFIKSELFKKNFFKDLEKSFSNNFLGFLKLLSDKNFSSFREIKKILNMKNTYKKNFNFEPKNLSNNSNSINKRYSIDTRNSRKVNNQNRFSLARNQRNNYDSYNTNNNINKLENSYRDYSSNTNDFNPFKSPTEKENYLKNLSPPKKNKNLFKKEINTPTALNYNYKNNQYKKNVKSFSDYTSNKDLFNNVNLNKIDSLKNLNPIDEKIENNYYKETIKKKLFQENNYEEKKSKKSSLEKTLKKSKSKIFFNNKNPEPQINKNHFRMILNNEKILFKHHIKNIFNYFSSINGIVNRSDPQKPSMYHNVEKFPLNKRKKKYTNINKYYQKVSLKNLDKLNSFNNFDKFNTKENQYMKIDKKKIGRTFSQKRNVVKRYNSSNDLKRGNVSRKLFEDRVNVMEFRGRRF